MSFHTLLLQRAFPFFERNFHRLNAPCQSPRLPIKPVSKPMPKRMLEIPKSIRNPNFPSIRPQWNLPPATSSIRPQWNLLPRLPPKTPPRNPKDFQRPNLTPQCLKREAETPIGLPIVRKIQLRFDFRPRLHPPRFFRPQALSVPFRPRGLRPISSRCPMSISTDASIPLKSVIQRTFPVRRALKISPFIRRAADYISKKSRPFRDIFPRRESRETSSF